MKSVDVFVQVKHINEGRNARLIQDELNRQLKKTGDGMRVLKEVSGRALNYTLYGCDFCDKPKQNK